MSTEFASRPQFFEGQYLGADDLQALIGYFSELMARHQLGSHSWGIAAGLDLVYQTSPKGDLEIYLTPGIAIDGYGRTIVVTEPFPIDAGLFAGQPAGLVDVWIRYDEAAGKGVRQGFEVCNVADAYARVIESFRIEVGARKTIEEHQAGVAVGDDAFADAREAPGWLLPGQPIAADGSLGAQRFPIAGDPDLWLVPLGRVLWQAGATVMPTPASAKQSRILRRYAGWIGEALHGSGGLLRLRGRFIARQAGSTVEQQCEALQPTENDLVYCTANPATPEFREPIWLEADTRARGHLRFYGTRAEWVDAGGTDYLPPLSASVTALRRTAPSPLKGVDLQVLLGQPQGTNGPSRLTIGAASVSGADPCALDFSYVPGVAFQQDGRVGIGALDKVLDRPLTIRALANGSLVGLQSSAGALAWQVNLAGGGLNFTQADPALSNLYLAANGNVGIGTQAPGAKLDIQQVSTPQNNPLGSGKWFQIGSAATPDAGQVWLQYGPQLAPLLVMSDLDDPPRVQFQQVGTGSEGAPQFASWIGMARNGSPDLALAGGSVGIGTLAPARTLHVLGNEIHSGGAGAGFSFENRETLAFVNIPAAGERWVWYATGGNATLWSGGNKLAVTPSGRLGIGTSAPAAALEVRGDIRLGGAGEYMAVAAGPRLMMVAGSVSGTGVEMTGSGFSSAFMPVLIPHYVLAFNPPFAAVPVVTVTLIDDSDNAVAVSDLAPNGCNISIRDVAPMGGDENNLQQTAFCFIAIGPRF